MLFNCNSFVMSKMHSQFVFMDVFSNDCLLYNSCYAFSTKKHFERLRYDLNENQTQSSSYASKRFNNYAM